MNIVAEGNMKGPESRTHRGFRMLGMGFALALAFSLPAAAQPGEGPGREDHERHGGHGGHGMGFEFNPRMMRELKLSPDQVSKLKADRLEAQKQKIKLFGEKATLELDLKNVLGTYPVDKAAAVKLAEKIADVDKRMTLQKVETLTRLLGSLTAEQHAKLLALQEEWIEKRKTWKAEMQRERKQYRDGKREQEGPDDKD